MFDPLKAYKNSTANTLPVESYSPDDNTDTAVSSGFDPVKNFQKTQNQDFSNFETTGFDPLKNFQKNKSTLPDTSTQEDDFQQPISSKPSSNGTDFVGGATSGLSSAFQQMISSSLSKKQVPKDLINLQACGIGTAQGWCGDYASRMSTASRVGDQWSQKINKVDHRSGAKAGDKLVIPLGVDKKGVGYGHVLVALIDEDANGNVLYAQSNGDGRQNKGLGPGIGSLVIYNTKDLQKRYGTNFGFLSGKLKVNPWKDKTLLGTPANAMARQQEATLASTSKTPPAASPNMFQNVAQAATGAGITYISDRFKSQLPKATNTQAQQSIDSFKNLLSGLPKGSSQAQKVQAEIDRLSQFTQTNNQSASKQVPAPPIPLDRSNPKVLADWVLKNNITDLQNQDWWKNSPAKKEAWKIIQAAKPTEIPLYGGDTSHLQQGKASDSPAFVSAVMGVLDPNGYFHTNDPTKDIKQNLNIIGKTVQQRVQTKVYDQPEGTLANNPVTRSLGNSVASVGKGIEELSGGESGNDNIQVVSGLKNIIFGGGGLASPGLAKFNLITQLPGINKAADAVFSSVGKANNTVLDATGVKKGEFRDLLETGLELAEFWAAHKVVSKGVELGKDVATNKTVRYTPEQVKAAYAEITSGIKDPKVPEVLRKKALELIKDSAEGVKQKEMLKSSYRNGITIKEARDFTGWFNKFFKGAESKTVTPEFQKLLTDGKKVVTGEKSAIEFTKDAREVLAKGDSATMRDELAKINPTDTNLYMEDSTGNKPIQRISELHNQLADLQTQGAKDVVSVGDVADPVLKISTYTYSDNKVGVSVKLNTEEDNISIPMNGKYSSPQEAVKAVLPTIEKTISNAWDTKSEQVRSELDRLKNNDFKEIPTKGEIMPWDDNYVAPPPSEDIGKLSKEQIQKKIDSIVDDYIELGLKPGMGQGVTPGGLARDSKTGEVVGRQGRVSNNAEWYSKAYKEFGRAPSQAQLREIAIDHLMNGVNDATIGELPPDENFRKLMQASVSAKSEKKPVVPKNEKKVSIIEGSGKAKTRSLALGVEQTAIKNRLTSEFGDLPSYKEVKMADQAIKAAALIQADPIKAKDVAMGKVPPPHGILPESVFVALEEKAIKEGDISTLRDLAMNSTLTGEATLMGQRLRTLGERDPESPIAAIKAIARARENAVLKHMKKIKIKKAATIATEKKVVIKEIKEHIKKVRPTKADWGSFIESLKC